MNISNRFSRTAALLICGAAAFAQTAPPQPLTGPGGSTYPFGADVLTGPLGDPSPTGENTFYIDQPSSPTPASAPVVLFLHGYQADSVTSYQSWMAHLARMGYTVIWAQYDVNTSAADFVTKALSNFRIALTMLQTQPGFVPPLTDIHGIPVTGIVGHSAGAFLSFGLASLSSNPLNLIPPFRAVVAIEPGQGSIPTLDVSGILPATKMVVVVGDQDKVKRRCEASTLWADTSQVSAANRDFLEVISDAHGTPQQLGNHFFPLTWTSKDTVPPPSDDDRDYNVTWKLSVGIMNCAIFKTDCEYGLGHGSASQTSMGQWSDSLPVSPLAWIQDPPTYFAAECAQNQ